MIDKKKSPNPKKLSKKKQKELEEDLRDLKIFEERANEPTISYEKVLLELKRDGKI
ncbi:MAG: hypothetical protein ABI638_08275 [Ignavibacteriota bacterium]